MLGINGEEDEQPASKRAVAKKVLALDRCRYLGRSYTEE